MPLKRYGVLKGWITHRLRPKSNKDHYQILVTDGSKLHRVAVNVLSKVKPGELLYFTTETLPAAWRSTLKQLPPGFTALKSKPGGAAIDFVRGGLFKRTGMKVLPNIKPGPKNDLGDLIDDAVMLAIHEDQPQVYAFGERWGPEKIADKYFDFEPGQGIHDIHMNQGNVKQFRGDDGIWQDGALVLHFPAGSAGPNEKWIGIFLGFQSQSWQTDNKGHTTGGGGTPPPPTKKKPGKKKPAKKKNGY
jgi:uncharacterized protein YukJ